MPSTILTDRGVRQITEAAGSGLSVAISHVALGDGAGGTYDPDPTRAGLQGERARRAISRRHLVDPNAWRVTAEFGPETPAFLVREIGFFAGAGADQPGGGTMIALWAGADVVPRETGAVTYIAEYVLAFSSVAEGVVIIDAPDDEVFDLAIATGTALANLQLRQLILEARVNPAPNVDPPLPAA